LVKIHFILTIHSDLRWSAIRLDDNLKSDLWDYSETNPRTCFDDCVIGASNQVQSGVVLFDGIPTSPQREGGKELGLGVIKCLMRHNGGF